MRSRAQRTRDLRVRNYEGGIDHDSWIRLHPCIICAPGEQRKPTRAAHAFARGMGGCNGSAEDLFPGCDDHHAEYDAGPETFVAKYGIDPKEVAAKLWREHQDDLANGIHREAFP